MRGGLLVILAGVLPITASFTNTQMGRQWFQKAIGWTLAFILYKPAAALIYAAAFRLTGSDAFGANGVGIVSILTGMGLMILALFGIVVVRSLIRLTAERDTFTRLAGSGLACIFGVQAMINMGVAVRLLPAKGMTLPFVSYGGSSVIAAGITMGMLLALTRSRPRGQMSDVFRRGR